MSKQTVEEAAIQYDADTFGVPKKGAPVAMTEDKASDFIIEAVKYGAAWQREQGIDWISVSQESPLLKDDFATPILITDGKTFKVWYLIFDKKLVTGDFKTTHWSYINLPQNTEK